MTTNTTDIAQVIEALPLQNVQHGAWRDAYIALGANLGDKTASLEKAVEIFKALTNDGIHVEKVSRWYQTSPVDCTGPDYFNGVMKISTDWAAEDLLDLCLSVEYLFGRRRTPGKINEPRQIDLDVLMVEGETSNTEKLMLPHPRMHERLFVLIPLKDVCASWTDDQGRNIDEVIDILKTRYFEHSVFAIS